METKPHNLPKQNFTFSFTLKCYPVSLIAKWELEKGDKIMLPPTVLENISCVDVAWPLMFEVHSRFSGRTTHCGVWEFVADEGCAYLPFWMMQNLAIPAGETLFFRYKYLEKGTFVKIQPHTADFLEITSPKAVLEAKLRNFTCLSKSDTIAIAYNGKIYWLQVVEVKPGNSISIVDADVHVDFIAPSPRGKTDVPEGSTPGIGNRKDQDSSTEQ